MPFYKFLFSLFNIYFEHIILKARNVRFKTVFFKYHNEVLMQHFNKILNTRVLGVRIGEHSHYRA